MLDTIKNPYWKMGESLNEWWQSMVEAIKKPHGLITLAIILAIGFSCFYSRIYTFMLILAYCAFKCWDFASQGLVRYRPKYSLVLLSFVLIFFGTSDSYNKREMALSGCHIVSATVSRKYTTSNSRGNVTYHTIASYHSRGHKLCIEDLSDIHIYNNVPEGQCFIMAAPLSDPWDYIPLEYNPSDKLVARTRNGIYAKGSLSTLDNVKDDANVRASFLDFDKPGMLDFCKENPWTYIFVLLILCFLFSLMGDKGLACSPFMALAIVTFLMFVTHRGFVYIASSCIIFTVVIYLKDMTVFSRVKNEIYRNGGYIAIGDYAMVGYGKSSKFEVLFTDAVGNRRRERAIKYCGKNVIIAHSAFNDIDIICLNEKPTEELLEEYKNGKFIGPCSKIDLNNAQEDDKLRARYEKLYTKKDK